MVFHHSGSDVEPNPPLGRSCYGAQNVPAVYGAADVVCRAGLVGSATVLFAANCPRSAGCGRARLLRADMGERNEDFRSAESIWRSVLEVRPDNARARTSLGVALADEGRFPAAIALYKQSLNQWPTYADAHYNLANALLESGDSEQAVEHYRRAIKNAPDDARAHVNLGTALGRMGKHQESASHYLEALRLDPDFALAHNNLAIALRS
jgi:tetratricopeptide (TPR) repeat protein